MDFTKKIILLVFFLFLLVFVPRVIFAQEFKTNYSVEYFLKQNAKSLDSQVRFKIAITNLKNDLYVNKFTLSFPSTFSITNIKASDDSGEIIPELTTDDDKTKIDLEFINPKTGRETVNNFYLSFNQHNLFTVSGNVWEVILPTIEGKDSKDYQVIVHLPDSSQKKLTIAKPKPTRIASNTIYWDNPQTRTIYAVFGDKQIYDVRLQYHLKNDRLTPVITEVAFPPDTLYQKVFIKKITPEPSRIYLDEDGNFIGLYALKPKERKKISYESAIEVYATARSDLQETVRDEIALQKSYLLSATKYWEITNLNQIKDLKNVADIYYYVTNNLKYNYTRINKNLKRLGADTALKNPTLAVCTEFSDVFVAIAREKGIYAREIEGYGFSQDSKLRPLSLIADVLHSWPEYFDTKTSLWKPVDPTWENTSGIDYFSSFDINHIAFAVHGKKSDYPYPAGMYKIDDTKDVEIKATSKVPEERKNIQVAFLNIKKTIAQNSTSTLKVIIKNGGNTFQHRLPLKITSENIVITPSEFTIVHLAPGQEQTFKANYTAAGGIENTGKINVLIQGNVLSQVFKIVPSYFYIVVSISALTVIFGGIFLYLRYLRKK